MLSLLCLVLLLGSTGASKLQSRYSSFEGEYGGGGGTAFSFSGQQTNGPITGLRVKEDSNYILGLQFRYGNHWSPYYGNTGGTQHEVLLQPGENITQVSGKKAAYVNELVFITSSGRYFRFGQPSGTSFNDFPLFPGTILRYVSGRYSTLIHSIGFHWGLCFQC